MVSHAQPFNAASKGTFTMNEFTWVKHWPLFLLFALPALVCLLYWFVVRITKRKKRSEPEYVELLPYEKLGSNYHHDLDASKRA